MIIGSWIERRGSSQTLIPAVTELQNTWNRGFPVGSAVKDPPANAGDVGSVPDPGR